MVVKRYNKIHKQMSAILGYECVFDNSIDEYLTIRGVIIELNEQYKEIMELKRINKRLYDENNELKQELGKLNTFKRILDYSQKEKEERVDWQSYCEKEFGGL